VGFKEASLVLQTASGSQNLTMLARGKSNFAHSPWGRKMNVEKALGKQLNGIVIQPGEIFSFNDAMKGVSGWMDAYVIVNGKDLVKEPGGGICQAATTMFRAALLAGLPVLKRANHSLYITYYKAFGVGIDATVYSGKQDLTFRNDTANPIVIVSRADGDDAIVELYGVPDGRTVSMNGPFFVPTKPDSIEKLERNQIAWEHDVMFSDGHTIHTTILSTYASGLPRKLASEFSMPRGIGELLATATGNTVLTAMKAL